jgi:hypothetical protein
MTFFWIMTNRLATFFNQEGKLVENIRMRYSKYTWRGQEKLGAN